MKNIISTDKAPRAIGPYSAGVSISNMVFTAGQLGMDPKSGELVSGGIESETRQAIENLQNILEAAGSSLDQVVKTTVFLKDMDEFPLMNKVYADFFSKGAPARSTIQVCKLPKDASVEIEAIAVLG